MEVKSTIRYETYTMTPEEEIKWLRQCVRELQEENQELKKQLENQVMSISCNGEHKVCEYYKQCYFKEIKQKEFIKYLEDNEIKFDIKANGMSASSVRDELIIKARVYREILSKYKEIIGSDNSGQNT